MTTSLNRARVRRLLKHGAGDQKPHGNRDGTGVDEPAIKRAREVARVGKTSIHRIYMEGDEKPSKELGENGETLGLAIANKAVREVVAELREGGTYVRINGVRTYRHEKKLGRPDLWLFDVMVTEGPRKQANSGPWYEDWDHRIKDFEHFDVAKHHGGASGTENHPSGSPQSVHGTGGGGGDTPTDPASSPTPGVPAPTRGGTRAARPKNLSELIGQDDVRNRLGMMVRSAKGQGHPLDHLLFGGPPGLGKTTFAHAMAAEMGTQIKISAANQLNTPQDVVDLFKDIKQGDIVFIDEIHALAPEIEEMLYPLMEDYTLDMPVSAVDSMPGLSDAARRMFGDKLKGAPTTVQRVQLPQFTLIGATTNTGGLMKPFRDRFGATEKLEFYTPDALAEVATRTAGAIGLELSHEAAHEIGIRGRGTPRAINTMLRRVKDYAYDQGQSVVTPQLAADALTTWGVDSKGLRLEDRSVLRTLQSYGKPMALTTISSMTGTAEAEIHTVVEPYLLRMGYIAYGPQGRTLTQAGADHLASLPPELVNKSYDGPSFNSTIQIAKVNPHKNLVFGWANVAFTKGNQVEDMQGHSIDVEDLEDTAYKFVVKYRISGEMHSGDSFGELVESLVVTEDKIAKAGFPKEMLGHWWVGFRLPPDKFQKVLDGKLLMFSIQGRARLEELV